jgi:cyclophilin family peptidyl-prolyl cis-trans isomerase
METSLGSITIKLYNKTPLHKANFLKLISEDFYEGVKFHRVIKGFMAQAGDPNSKNNDFSGQLGQKSYGETIPAEFFPDYIHKKGALAAARMGDNVNPEKKSSGSQFYLVQGKTYSEMQLNQMEQKINQQQENILIGKFLKKSENIHYMDQIKYCQQNRLNDSLNLLYQEIKSLVINEEENKFSFSKDAIETYKTIGGTPFLDNGYTVFGEVIEGLEIIDNICAVPTLGADVPVKPVMILSIKIKE